MAGSSYRRKIDLAGRIVDIDDKKLTFIYTDIESQERLWDFAKPLFQHNYRLPFNKQKFTVHSAIITPEMQVGADFTLTVATQYYTFKDPKSGDQIKGYKLILADIKPCGGVDKAVAAQLSTTKT